MFNMFSSPFLLVALTFLRSTSAIPSDLSSGFVDKAATTTGADISTFCDSISANTATYLVRSNDTISTIAAAVNRGVCDISRYNRMADAELMNPRESLLIPSETSTPDNSTCLLTQQSATRDCIYGGPRTYTSVAGDTLERIALYKFNITVKSLSGTVTNVTDSTAEITTGTTMKIPQCNPSQCIAKPYRFSCGTYKDLAEQYGTTVGQLLAFNTSYKYSHALNSSTAPVITIPMNCTALSTNVSPIS